MTYLGDNELRSIAARTVVESRLPHIQKLLDALSRSVLGDDITLPFDTMRMCCAELAERTKVAALLATEVLEMRQAEPRAKLAVQCCANCQFRLPGRDSSVPPGGSDTPISVCAANPPNPVTRMVDGRQHSVGLFTEVQDDDWCGRWVRYSHRRVEA